MKTTAMWGVTLAAGALFAGDAAAKVSVCHVAGGSGKVNVISVAEAAVPAHLAHGDTLAGDYWEDLDGDGYGGAPSASPCGGPGLVTVGGDCDDQDAGVYPAAAEVCDGVDTDCDGLGGEEACQDGNAEDGDGCSATCEPEAPQGCQSLIVHEPTGPNACDPVLTTIVGAVPTDDNMMIQDGASARLGDNLGTFRELQVGAYQWFNYWRTWSLLRFDLSQIPADAQVLDATVTLYATATCASSGPNPETCGTYAGTYTVGFHALRRPFDELTSSYLRADAATTWGSPAAGSTSVDRYATLDGALSLTDASGGQYHDVDLTASVADYVSGTLPNHGWRLSVLEPISHYQSRFVIFASSDTQACDERPVMTVLWSPCGAP